MTRMKSRATNGVLSVLGLLWTVSPILAAPAAQPFPRTAAPVTAPATLPNPRQARAEARMASVALTPFIAKQAGLNTVDLQWNAAPYVGVSYTVTGPGLPSTGATATTNTLRVTNVPAGAARVFNVSLVRDALQLANASVTVDVSPILIQPPSLLARPPDYTVHINYAGTANIAKVFRSAGDTAHFVEVAIGQSFPGSVWVFDNSLNQGWNYYYRMQVKMPDGSEMFTDSAVVNIPVVRLQPIVLSAPARIHLQWNPFSVNNDYTIQKLVAPGALNFDYIRDSSGQPLHITNALSYDDSLVGPGQTFYYAVCGVGPLGEVCAGGLSQPIKLP